MTTLFDATGDAGLTVVVGRPGSGVSRCLAGVAAAIASAGQRAVLASWECSRDRLAADPRLRDVVLPQTIGLTVAELVRSEQPTQGERPRAVVLDHLALMGPHEEVLPTVTAVADDRPVFLGVMAARRLAFLADHPGGQEAVARVVEALDDVTARANTLVVLTNEHAPRTTVARRSGSNAHVWCGRMWP